MNSYNKDNLPLELDNEELKKALTVLDVMNFGEEEREIYEGHLKWLRVESNTLKKSEAKGFEEGDNFRVRKTVLNMHKMRMDVDTISKAIEFTCEAVEKIIKEEKISKNE